MATFLVVGGSSGIGLEVTNQLAAAGHIVYATYNTHVMESLGNIHYHNINVLDESINLDFLPASIEGIVYCPGAISLRPFNRIASEDFIKDYNLQVVGAIKVCLLYTSPSPRDRQKSRMPSSA